MSTKTVVLNTYGRQFIIDTKGTLQSCMFSGTATSSLYEGDLTLVIQKLIFYSHGNTKRTRFHSYKNKPQDPKESNRKKMITILEKFMEYCT